ncbi:MAG: glycoside hydrolase family 25 [Oscillospiraceae bacterium]|nr:glycoside hydrolase family 25 [Oscillospiraceae bacterium]
MISITKKMWRSLIAWGGLLAVLLVVGLLIWRGVLWFNMPSRRKYPVRGVDVSHYQGAVDWDVIASQGISFAFIKATEGSGSVDERFAENWENARKSEIYAGAYHFFSFDSPADTQADNFCSVVPVAEDSLPPVVDLELYRTDDLPDVEAVRENLRILLDRLREKYGKTPIIYTTNTCWERYLRDSDLEYTLWIRSILKPPSSHYSPPWEFWQYNPRGILDGCDGDEQFIDLNAFCGTGEEFLEKYG